MKKIFTLVLCAVAVLVARAQISLNDLTIVGETTFSITQEPRYDWGNESYDVPTEGIAELLGVEAAYLQENLGSMLYAATMNSATDQPDALVNNGDAVPSPGFYFAEEMAADSETGEEYAVCVNHYGWGGALFFLIDFQFDAANANSIHLAAGQVPPSMSTLELNKTYCPELYIVNESKAYAIHINYTVGTPEQDLTLENLTAVGSDEWVVDMRDPRKAWDELDEYELDMDGIAAKFSAAMGKEIAVSDLKLMAINEYDGVTDIYTADNSDESKGFWFTAETGKTQAYEWGTKSYFINYSIEEGKLYVGNMPNAFSGGEEMSTKLYFVAEGTHCYEIAFTMTIAAPEFTLETCEMQEMNMVVQLVPSTDGSWDIRHLDVAYIEEMLGTADLKFYGVTAEGEITTNYSVSEAAQGGGGFWMSPLDENGWAHAAGYTGNGAFAIWYTGAGEMWFFNQPGLPQWGDKVKATFYMANLFDGKALKINMTVRYVEEIKEVTPVGTENITLAARDESGEYYSEVEMDLTKCAEAFEVDVETLKESAEMQVINPDGDLTAEGQNDEGMFSFNADGEQVAADAEDAVFQIGLQEGMIRSLIISDDNLGNAYNAVVYIVYGEQVYAYNVTIGANESDAITAVEAAPSNAKTYDLMGREVAKPSKGIYIKDGKKYMVK